MKKLKSQVFKSVKKDQQSFRITKKLLDGIYSKADNLKNKVELVLTIPINDKESYQVTCQIKKLITLKGI